MTVFLAGAAARQAPTESPQTSGNSHTSAIPTLVRRELKVRKFRKGPTPLDIFVPENCITTSTNNKFSRASISFHATLPADVTFWHARFRKSIIRTWLSGDPSTGWMVSRMPVQEVGDEAMIGYASRMRTESECRSKNVARRREVSAAARSTVNLLMLRSRVLGLVHLPA